MRGFVTWLNGLWNFFLFCFSFSKVKRVYVCMPLLICMYVYIYIAVIYGAHKLQIRLLVLLHMCVCLHISQVAGYANILFDLL